MKTFTLALVIVMASFLSSCSTSVQITSEPSGADVQLNGEPQGKTPLTLSLSDIDWNQYTVTLSKTGYQDKTAVLDHELKTGTFIGGFFFWPCWLWSYGPTPVHHYQLIPKTPANQ